jgi:hypothetical protein
MKKNKGTSFIVTTQQLKTSKDLNHCDVFEESKTVRTSKKQNYHFKAGGIIERHW